MSGGNMNYDEMKFQEWASRGIKLVRAECSNKFAIGDWILNGENVFQSTMTLQDLLLKAHCLTGLSTTTLGLYRLTAQKFPAEHRTEELSYAHHQEASTLETIEERVRALDYARKNKISKSMLRKWIKMQRVPEANKAVKEDFSCRCPECGYRGYDSTFRV